MASDGENESTVDIRTPVRVLDTPWPFQYSVVPGKGLVRNVPPGSVAPSAAGTGEADTVRGELARRGIQSATYSNGKSAKAGRQGASERVEPIDLGWIVKQPSKDGL